jgi:hypothetical protein
MQASRAASTLTSNAYTSAVISVERSRKAVVALYALACLTWMSVRATSNTVQHCCTYTTHKAVVYNEQRSRSSTTYRLNVSRKAQQCTVCYTSTLQYCKKISNLISSSTVSVLAAVSKVSQPLQVSQSSCVLSVTGCCCCCCSLLSCC